MLINAHGMQVLSLAKKLAALSRQSLQRVDIPESEKKELEDIKAAAEYFIAKLDGQVR